MHQDDSFSIDKIHANPLDTIYTDYTSHICLQYSFTAECGFFGSKARLLWEVSTFVCSRTHTHTHSNANTHRHTNTRTRAHARKRVREHKHTHTETHTYTLTHTQAWRREGGRDRWRENRYTSLFVFFSWEGGTYIYLIFEISSLWIVALFDGGNCESE